MKTVQHYVRSLDSKRLIETYLRCFPIDCTRLEGTARTQSIDELQCVAYDRLCGYIERLRNLDLETVDDASPEFRGVFYVHRAIGKHDAELVVDLINLNEYVELGDDAEDYAYTCTGQAIVLGYKVSEARYTQRHVYEVVASVMYTLCWFGFKEEGLAEFLEDSDCEDAEEADGDFAGEPEARIRELAKERAEKNTEGEEALLREAKNAAHWCFLYSWKLERQAMMNCVSSA